MIPALNNKGAAFIDIGKYQETIEYFDRVLAIDPNKEMHHIAKS
jgi:tetratricopeptide (TPR) repeat protein